MDSATLVPMVPIALLVIYLFVLNIYKYIVLQEYAGGRAGFTFYESKFFLGLFTNKKALFLSNTIPALPEILTLFALPIFGLCWSIIGIRRGLDYISTEWEKLQGE